MHLLMDMAYSQELHLSLTSTPPRCPAHFQLFNTFPRLGALLRLHRPVLSKIEEVRAILRTLLEAQRPPLSSGRPVQSYMEALLQRGQVWAGPGFPQSPGVGTRGSHSSGEGNCRRVLSHLLGTSGSLLSSLRLVPVSTRSEQWGWVDPR